MAPRPPSHLSLAVVLALTAAIGPFSLDAYLPAFPAMAESLGVSISDVSLSVSVYIFTMSIGQLIGGPLSDQLGRQKIMFSGLILYSVASLLIWQSEQLESLLAFRALQAFAAGWTLVSVPALVRDRVQGVEAARLFSLIGLIMVVAPGIAPTVGGLLLSLGGWSFIFLFLALYALLVIPLLKLVAFKKTGAAPKGAPGPKVNILRRYAQVLATRQALPFLFWQAASFSVLMIFVTHASFVYQTHFGANEHTFGLLFGANVIVMLIANLTNRSLLERFGSRRILRGATCIQATAIVVLILASVFDAGLYVFLPAMMVSIGMVGAIAPNIQATFIEYFGVNSGTAAALLGASQFGIAGIVSALSSRLPTSVTAVVLAMAACSAVCLCMLVLSLRQERAAV
ncbi:multidrug effflux MFS transporter [Kushneria phyllosphaerae]|uniref:Bcr/CflA family efflux transporter n=1 Tax=Kushneria phyllosphaerae TaxID=2100822 RepID=A0A2R8CI11_9GAMM|nr:multidrug effflux MFS transporter [Kushneria phyllosphaerae]SPJ32526.1 Bicyclomycin resistance protein [Kushneria phyllosphaerae]